MLEKHRQEVIHQKEELETHHTQPESLVKERTEELESALNKAKESDMLKSAFLANMSHEIRTPMNAIVGFSSLLDDANLTPEERATMVEIINANSVSLLTLIDDILDLSLNEANQLLINKKPFYLNEIVNQLYTCFRLSNKEPGIEIRVNNTLREKNLKVYTDRERLKQVLINLMTNACKFTKEGFIELGLHTKNGILFIYVKDTGIGIEEEDLQHLFERFRKMGEEKEFIVRGAGLGLAISQKIAKLLGGDLLVTSDPGNGSVFTFQIELDKFTDNDASGVHNENNAPVAESKWNNKLILLMNDMETN